MLASNTSTIVLLAKVSCLEDFIQISPIIEVPVQVKKEALFDKDSYYAKVIEKLIQNKKIKIVPVEETYITRIMQEFNLDKGEAATYAMFNDKKHKAILTDDGELIKLCKLEKVPFICAMAVIIRLFEKKKLSKEKTIDKLEELNRVGRYSEKLYKYYRAEVK